jgi:predicted nucleic acid-binding protein
MNRIVIDTDVFSYAFKGDSRIRKFGALLDSAEICLSFVTMRRS